MTARPAAWMRALGERSGPPLAIVPLDRAPSVICVAVPGFGHVLLRRPDGQHKEWAAVITAPPAEPRRLPCQIVAGRVEVEMLHNADRLTLVVEPFDTPNPPTERTQR